MTHRRFWLALAPLLFLTAPASAAEPDKLDAPALAQRIDRWVAARWDKAGVKPAERCDDGEFLRRAYLDLVGRIPPVNEVRDFLDDPAADKRAQLIDRLLKGEQHATHQAAVWRAMILPANDQQQFANTGFEQWLRQRLKAGDGFDRVARALIATDQRDPGAFQFQQAVGGKPEDLGAATSRLFLGVKVECAQCHDHPFGKWKRQDFWQFAAFFSGPGPFGQPGAGNGKEITIPGTDKKVPARFLDGSAPAFAAGVDPRATLAEWVTAPENPYFARNAANRTWEYLFGTGLLDPVDEPSDQNRPSHPELLDELAAQLAAHNFDHAYLTRAIMLSKAYQLTSKASDPTQSDPRVFARMAVRGLSPEQVFDSLTEAVGQQLADDLAQQPGRFGQFGTARAEFLARFPAQGKRTETQTSILQALYLMNGRLMADATSLKKNRALSVIADSKSSTARKVEELYLVTLSRRPTSEEKERLVKHVEKGDERQALADVFWALLNSTEFTVNH
jgi:hypothetical protein